MAAARRPLIWDLPTRAVHWTLAVLVPFSWWSATHSHLPWHRLSGYTILGLLAFRLGWGIWGPETARFSRFLAGPKRVRAYLGGRFSRFVGHNPLGGWSVVAMLAALCLQVSLGLFSIDVDSLQPGPLARFLSFDDARAVAHVHHFVFWVVVALIALHLAAIAVYAARGRNLVAPMLSGRGEIPEGASAPRPAPLWRAIVIALAAVALAWFVGHGLRVTPAPASPISGLDS
ncbi:MAG TPA: cytochrome b/b6 domain-containing protein [Caulobacteraceae bacterium]